MRWSQCFSSSESLLVERSFLFEALVGSSVAQTDLHLAPHPSSPAAHMALWAFRLGTFVRAYLRETRRIYHIAAIQNPSRLNFLRSGSNKAAGLGLENLGKADTRVWFSVAIGDPLEKEV